MHKYKSIMPLKVISSPVAAVIFCLMLNISGASGSTVTLDPSVRHQEMIGFGGSLTWYADRVLTNPNSEAIKQLVFEDLGLDFIRLQNWYFPTNYPQNKSVNGMADLTMFNANETFYTLAKQHGIKVMLSSWGPPASLKNNNHTREGTLRKENGRFLYDEYAQYWIDSLDHMGFVPDYLSMQNEPDYIDSGWTTSEWRPTETADFPGYAEALEILADRLAERPHAPLLIAPETGNIGQALWNGSLNTFREFSTPLKGKDYVHAYAYHIYQIWNESRIEADIPLFRMVRDEFGDKPNFMTEYSKTEFGWLETARLIQIALTEANTSAYLHWNMVWDAESPDAMIGVSYASSYIVRENYYVLKHFSRHIDAGYVRIGLSGSDATAKFSAFASPDGRKLVVHAVNSGEADRAFDWNLHTLPANGVTAFRTTDTIAYAELGEVTLAQDLTLPARSLSTYVLELSEPILPIQTWAGLPVHENGWVETPWLRWLYVDTAPWTWHHDFGWIYIDEPVAEDPGIWGYIMR